jgi:hypothetical protein
VDAVLVVLVAGIASLLWRLISAVERIEDLLRAGAGRDLDPASDGGTD